MPSCITHTDLDGIGCAILLEKVFPDIKTYPVDYKDLDSVLKPVLEASQDGKIFITDISLNERQAELCNRFSGVQHVDHHVSNKPTSDKYPWSFTDIRNCATYHLWNILSQYAILGDYKDFVDLVDDYDTWGHGTSPTGRAKDLNRLLKMVGPDAFLERFKLKSSPIFSETETALINADKHLEQGYLEEAIKRVQAMKDNNGHNFLLIAAEQYTSSLGNYLLNQFEEADYIVILDMLHDKASLRSLGKVDVSKIAKDCGGGGHPKAAGFIMNEAALDMFWRCNNCEYRKNCSEPMDE